MSTGPNPISSDPGGEGDSRVDSALPPRGARILAFASILVAGLCGGLIGLAFTELQCSGDCTVATGAGTLVGAVIAAGGVAVVAVLVLRAMGEWHTIRDRRSAGAAFPRRAGGAISTPRRRPSSSNDQGPPTTNR